MLRTLDIRDVLIIDRLSLTFQPGLNVLTGETGAGKSILLDALGFVLGWRGRSDLVRLGADQGEVTVVFDLDADHAARGVLDVAGIAVENEVFLRRVISADGRKTSYINDRRVSGDVLRDLSEFLVELHGTTLGIVNVKGVTATDWEDMCAFELDGESWLLIGDIGDNQRVRGTKSPSCQLLLLSDV